MHPLIFWYSFSLGDDGTSRPTLPELLRLKVPQEVGAHYTIFGVLLLDDKTGSRVEALKMECLGVPGNITQKILQEWLEGKGTGACDVEDSHTDTQRLWTLFSR